MTDTFEQLIERSTPPMNKFVQSTLSRLLLSYVPMIDYLSRLDVMPASVASFGSGSCAHEAFLSYALPESKISCHDVTDQYIPNYLRDEVLSPNGNIIFNLLNMENGNVNLYKDKFDFVFTIQTLEDIENYRAFLELLSISVKPGGFLYLDAPYYHMDDSHEDPQELAAARARQWEVNEHYYLGFSPTKLADDPLLDDYTVLHSGYYSFQTGDQNVMRTFRRPEFGAVKATSQFSIGMSYLMKNALDIKDVEPDLDDLGYFKKPASAFRMLLRKNL